MNASTQPKTMYLWLTGILLIVLGIVAISSPAIVGVAVIYIVGGVLLLAGIVQFIQGIKESKWSSKLFALILGIVTALCGLAVLAHPIVGMEILTLLLAILFITEGVWKIITSFSFRPAAGWFFVLVSGLLAIVLGVLIWQQWPLSGEYAIGILVGVDLLLTGISMIALALTVRRINKIATSQTSQQSPV